MEPQFELIQYHEIIEGIAVDGGLRLAERLFNAIPAVQRARAEKALELVMARLDDREFHQRLLEQPRTFRIVADTMHAAARADTQAKLAALGAVATRGLQDTARYDEARHIIRVLDEIDVIHVRVLVALDDGDADPERDRDLDVSAFLQVSQGTAEAVCGDLIRLALAEPGGLSFRGLHSRLARISPFGKDALSVLRIAGTDPTVVDLP